MATTATGSRADLRAYEESMRLSPADLVGRMCESLGAKLVAYLGSVTETRAVRQWSEGTRAPSAEVLNRLRAAYQVTALLRQKDSAAVVQAWWQGMNPQLDDVSPARLLREGDLAMVGPRVLAAARAFASVG